jgi:peroxiredoxin
MRVDAGKVELDEVAPDFTLPDFRGRDVSLADFRDEKHVLLVFSRGFI